MDNRTCKEYCMRRQIKFRAWDDKDKKWLLGYEYPNLGGFSMFGETMLFEEWSHILNRFILQQDDRTPKDLILMQFTGLLDKNGKEIYEGDIVNVTANIDKNSRLDDLGILSVVWKRAGLFLDGYSNDLQWQVDNFDIKVIGNIYENANLLPE